MASHIPTLTNGQLRTYLEKQSNAINHFLNEQIRDAVEQLEGKPLSDLAISAHGKINLYDNGIKEFIWKGKPVLVVGVRQTKQGDLEVFAEHLYDNQHTTTLEEFNDV